MKTFNLLFLFAIIPLGLFGQIDKYNKHPLDNPLVGFDQDKLLAVDALKRYVIKEYGEDVYKNIHSYGFSGLRDGYWLSFQSTDKDGREVNLHFWILKVNNKYEVFEKLSSRISHHEVFSEMGEVFLKYYFVNSLKKEFDCYQVSTTPVDYFNAAKKGETVKFSYCYNKKANIPEDGDKKTYDYADVYFKFSNSSWKIVKVDIQKDFVSESGRITTELLGRISSDTIKEIVKSISKDEKYNKTITFQLD